MNKDILEWWVGQDELTPTERILVTTKRSNNYVLTSDENEIKKLDEEYFKRMPYCNLTTDNYTIRYGLCATDLIKELFNEYMTEETLLITSACEHENVRNIAETYPNRIMLMYDTEISVLNIDRVINEIKIKKYKKVFVYIIGAQLSSGEITPTEYYTKLKNALDIMGVQTIMVIDDVQEMFMLPRDYSCFDYVIGTGHSLVMEYDMGIIICNKKNKIIGLPIINWPTLYLPCLDVVLKRKEKIMSYQDVMRQYFACLFQYPYFKLLPNVAPQIFSVRVNKDVIIPKSVADKVKESFMYVDGWDHDDAEYIHLRIRAQQVIFKPEILLKGIKDVRKMLMYLVEEKDV